VEGQGLLSKVSLPTDLVEVQSVQLSLGSTILTLGFRLKAEALSNPKGLPGTKVPYDNPGLFATEELDCF